MVKTEVWEASFGGHEVSRVKLEGSHLAPCAVVIIADVHEALAMCSLCAEPCLDITAPHNPIAPFHREGS